MDIQLWNIVILGVGFFFSMGSLLACMLSETILLHGLNDDLFHGTPTMGYICLALNFAALTVTYALSPALSAVLGSKLLIVTGAAFLTISLTVYFRPLEITLYVGALSQGVGSGILWTVYSYFLSVNSTKQTIGRNTGSFWAIFHIGPVCWNLCLFSLSKTFADINKVRLMLFAILLPASGLGIAAFCLLRHPWQSIIGLTKQRVVESRDEATVTMTSIFRRILAEELKMAVSKNMLTLCPVFVYMGMEMTFWMNVYGTALGYTLRFGVERKQLVGLSGAVIGVGQITGGLVYAVLAKWLNKHGRDVATLFAFLFHLTAFYLAFLTLPDRSPLEETDKQTYLSVNACLTLICSFLLGFGDAGWNNALFSLLEAIYPHNSVAAFSVFQAYQAVGNLLSFAYSTFLTLPYQLAMLVVAAVAAHFGFCTVEWKVVTDEAKARTIPKNLSIASMLSEKTVATVLDSEETKI